MPVAMHKRPPHPLTGKKRACRHCGLGLPALGHSTHERYCGQPFGDVERFTAKVQRGADDACWPFMGARVPAGGYGRAWLNKKLVAAHRIAYMLAKGNIPGGLDVMHTCDNPPCCNPRHLKAVTTIENMADMAAKGRATGSPGKLDELTARAILAKKGVIRAEDAANEFDVSLSTVHNIWTGKAWKQLQEAA